MVPLTVMPLDEGQMDKLMVLQDALEDLMIVSHPYQCSFSSDGVTHKQPNYQDITSVYLVFLER